MTNYSIRNSPTGELTFFDTDTGEYLHRFFGPEQESRALYVQGCQLADRTGALNIGDLGLGAGFNVLSALKALEENQGLTQVTICSFDTTLSGLKLLAENFALFPAFAAYEKTAKEALQCFAHATEHNAASFEFQLQNNTPVKWTFFLGDAKLGIQRSAPEVRFHAVFYDFFSCQKTEDLWVRDAFEIFASRLDVDGILATYSTATPVRAILLSLGLYVGEGAKVSHALRGTLATPTLSRLGEPLDTRWQQRFSRSQRKFFDTEKETNKVTIENAIMTHPQFK